MRTGVVAGSYMGSSKTGAFAWLPGASLGRLDNEKSLVFDQ